VSYKDSSEDYHKPPKNLDDFDLDDLNSQDDELFDFENNTNQVTKPDVSKDKNNTEITNYLGNPTASNTNTNNQSSLKNNKNTRNKKNPNNLMEDDEKVEASPEEPADLE